ncbi:transcriptional antitermination N peptide [Lelliottia wanjuensis]|uniref:Regulator n=1 Tax=Lelliottia wanjuensis TaxID=3050585 RepID=A0AAP4LC91_9ENTR|nr:MULTISPECIES: regulator [unclassified Lelliottia]MDK9365372.1 regulator [Lelliottia sp. V106_12]MDK9617905.1 regulator [Lelliottia sp. V106_9]
MTVITYGSSVSAGNAKTRRHERRRKLAIERDSIANIIDSIFGCDAPDSSQEVSRKQLSRVDRATSLGSLRDSNTVGSACLPDVGLYAAGYRNSKDSVTAR